MDIRLIQCLEGPSRATWRRGFLFVPHFDLDSFKSNVFEMEWPPRSGRKQLFPEADRAGWFGPAEALRKIIKGQAPILETLLRRLVW